MLCSPVAVLVVEQAVEDLPQGAEVVQVVQNEHQRHLLSLDAAAAAALVSQVRQVLTELLDITVYQQQGEQAIIWYY